PVGRGADRAVVWGRGLQRQGRGQAPGGDPGPGVSGRGLRSEEHGFLSKEAPPEELLRAIESVCKGETYFSADFTSAALGEFVTRGGKGEPCIQLTVREREVLVRIAEGKSNKEIAHQLHLGVRTIETHRDRIMSRLNIHSVAGLTKYAIASGLISLEAGPDGTMVPDPENR
ncbi:MAG: response regulator transcription factor, partial [Verrucomicrobia bacterium]|nr:response regulator transcription factor [Verrucomicrobiota bacterium]